MLNCFFDRRRWLAHLCRHFTVLSCLLLIASISSIGKAHAAQPIALTDNQSSVDVWPSLTYFVDESAALTITQTIASSEKFITPQTAYGTLGIHKAPIWLKIPFHLSNESDGLWVLDIDYPPINRLDVYLTSNQQTVQQAVFSNLNTVAQRSLNGRAHTLVLKVRPGSSYDIYIRVENVGAMILPITISKPVTFHLRALTEQILQGVLLGIACCFLMFSLMSGITFRDTFFIKYALLITGGVLFSLLQTGIGGQYIWHGNRWIEMHMGGLSAFIASTGSFLFIEHALRKEMTPTLKRFMWFGAALCVFFGIIYSFDLIGIQLVTLLVSTLGLAPALLGLPGAIRLAKRGDRVGWYFLAAWLIYFVTTAILIEVIKGRVNVGFWTMHSFQFGATADMFIFMAVLGMQSQAVKEEVARTKFEHARLLASAHTDGLTSLPNRQSLYDSTNHALKTLGRNQFLAIYMMDLDKFKSINERYGQAVGDELIMAVAKKLQKTLSPSDVLSRLGGDEFAVLVTSFASIDEANKLGQKILKMFDDPFVLGKNICPCTTTIGLAIAPLHGKDTSYLLRQANEAMYSGKRMGGNQLIRATNPQGLSDEEMLALI
jgi:diguanylate cyclase